MHLLLLSHDLGALPAFLAEAVPGRTGRLRIAYVPDAAVAEAAFADATPADAPPTDAPFAADERARLAALGHDITVLQLTGTPLPDIARALDAADAVYLAGGNTFALLHALRSTGADRELVTRVRAGLPYIGLSAGAVVAGPTIDPIAPMDDATEVPELVSRDGLGLVDVVVVPHADGRSYPPAVIERIVAEYGERYPLRLLGDGEALVVGEGRVRVVGSV